MYNVSLITGMPPRSKVKLAGEIDSYWIEMMFVLCSLQYFLQSHLNLAHIAPTQLAIYPKLCLLEHAALYSHCLT